MTLRWKTLLIVGTILLAFLEVAYVVTSIFISRSSAHSEAQEARQALNGSVSVLAQTIGDQDQRFAGWSAWDDAYKFVQNGNRGYIDDNLMDETLANMRVNLLLFVDNSGKLVWGSGFDLATHKKTPVPKAIAAHLRPGDELLSHSGLHGTVAGIFMLPSYPLLIAARPIITSRNEGPIQGTLVIGRYLDASEIARFSHSARMNVSFARVDSPSMAGDSGAARAALLSGTGASMAHIGTHPSRNETGAVNSTFVQPLNDSEVAAYTVLPDIYGKPALIMRVNVPRETYRQSRLNLRTLMFSLLLAGAVFSFVTLALLQKLVLSRWEQLNRDLDLISRSQDLSRRVHVIGSDELSEVSRSTNRMLEALERAQKELFGSEARFKAFMNNSPMVTFIKDEKGRYVHVNPRFEKVLGIAEADWKNKTDFDLWPEETAKAIQKTDQQVFDSDVPMSFQQNTTEYQDIGSWITYKFPILDAGGERFLGGIAVDLSEQERTENALRESQHFLQSTLDALTAHIAILDESGIILEVNEAWRRFAKSNGYRGDSYGVGDNYLSVCATSITAHEAELTAAGIRALLSRRLDRFSLEYPCPSPTEPRWFHLSATRFSLDGTMRIVVAHENVTERKLVENSLRESEQRFRQMAENINEVFWLVDAVKNQLLYVSPAYETIWNRKVIELYHNPALWLDAIHPEDRARIEEAARTKQSVNEYDEEFRILRPDGEIRIVHDRAFPIYGEDGEVYRVVGIAEDVTLKSRVQKALQDAHDEMESRVETRTAQLGAANSALLLAKEEAERANAAKSELLSRVSHELRTPMSAILGFGELLKMDDLTSSQEDSVGEILKAGQHLLSLINHVLDVTGIEQKTKRVETEIVDAREILLGSVKQNSKLAELHQVEIELNLGETRALWVEGNAEMLSQLFSVLLENAIKYNHPEGKVSIDLDLEPDYFWNESTHRGGGSQNMTPLHVNFRDTGRGIAPENLSRIFAAFDRLDAATFGVTGTGIGLTLAKSFAETMGGRIDVRSTPGEGSVFSAELRGVDNFDSANHVLAPQQQTVLYIEDNVSNMRLVERIMARRKDLTLLSATRGEQGYAIAVEEEPALILLDIHLPDCSGEEILKRLLENPKTQKIPVVIVSADATAKQIEKLLAAGARDYITKPIDVQQLLRLLGERFPPTA